MADMTVERAAPVAASDARSGGGRGLMMAALRKWSTIVAMLIVCAGLSLATPYFLTASNVTNVIFTMVTSALVSLGLTYVVIAGSFDLSIGLIVTTTSIVTAMTMPAIGPVAGSVLALAVGCVVGVFNGVLVTYGRLSGIVVTLGTMFVLGGINNYLTHGYQIAVSGDQTAFLFLGQGTVADIPIPDLLLIGVFLVAHVFVTKTKVGHYISAVGDNPMAAYYSGIKVYRWVIISFVLSGLLCAVGGIVETSISSSAQPVGGEGYLLEAFAAVFLGATVFGRGKPHLFGTLVSALFLNFVTAGMNMIGAPFALHQLIEGGVLILAVGANAMLNREELHMRFI
ncbi:MAG: ABC transporter permease [Acetobacteraceae bacterium]